MNYVTELLEEQKELLTEEMRFAEGKELEQTKQRMTDVVDALNKLSIHGVSQQSELLPDFLYEDYGIIKVGVHGDSAVTDEWNDYLKKLGNCG